MAHANFTVARFAGITVTFVGHLYCSSCVLRWGGGMGE